MTAIKRSMMAAAGNAGGDNLYVEDVFSTYLYAGNSTAGRVIVNDIDLSGEGGLAWIKDRTLGDSNSLFTTDRGANKTLLTDTSGAEDTVGTDVFQAFNSNGFTVGSHGRTNENNRDYASWTFRKAPGFFDVVTYTGTGAAHAINHALGSVPGCIMVKNLSASDPWKVYHKSNTANPETDYLVLNTTAATVDDATVWNDTLPTSTQFTVGTHTDVNTSGESYVAYIFADDDQSFGADGDESVIKCGSYTGSGGSGQEINLGFEPQWVLVKNTSRAGQTWVIVDVMRQFDNTGYGWLYPNSSASEASGTGAVYASPTATGFKTYGNNAAFDYLTDSYIYIAIRRPMKTPEAGTEVFTPNDYTGNSTSGTILTSSNDPVDLAIVKRANSTGQWVWSDRLRGAKQTLFSDSTDEESTENGGITGFDVQSGIEIGSDTLVNASGWDYISYMLSRATGFFDVVAYIGNGVAGRTVTHNLGVVPEIMIVKRRSRFESWQVYSKDMPADEYTQMNGTAGFTDVNGTLRWNNTRPTDSVFSVGTHNSVNSSEETFIAYLFATLAGVSKVGSYTGTGADLNVDCGFSAGARFILIKRADSTGDWYVWDSARGIVAGNDPYLRLNSTSAEVTGTDYIDPLASGFTVTSSAPAALNASGGSYIFLAIA